MIKFINSVFLQNIWFFLWCLIWSIYIIVDSFTLGIGLLSLFKVNNNNDIDKMIHTISPFWGGNQVWLILAAGGTFAAFPLIFSKMFTWLYLPMMLLLFGLILRGLSIELIHDESDEKLKRIYKISFITGSSIITVVLGLFFSNLFYGLLIGSNYYYYGTFFGLINKFTVFGVVLFSLLFILSGYLWLSYKTKNNFSVECYKIGKKVSIIYFFCLLLYLISLFNIKNFSVNYIKHSIYYMIPIVSCLFSMIVCIILNKLNNSYKNILYSMIFHYLSILSLMFTGFITLHPYILKSSIDSIYGVSIYVSSSSELTLFLMLVSAFIFVPIVLFYQMVSYFIFKEKY